MTEAAREMRRAQGNEELYVAQVGFVDAQRARLGTFARLDHG
jgi:hypothetical protein